MSDISDIKNNVDIEQVIGRFVQLKQDGPHWKACCPLPNHGRDKTPSFTVTPSKKMFKCFGCGQAGDVIDFLVQAAGKTFQEALQYLKDPNNTEAIPLTGKKNNKSFAQEKVIEWKHIYPGLMIDGMFHHYKHGVPSKYWSWEDKKGHIIGYTCRFDLEDGKQVLPLIFATNGKRQMWRYGGFKKPRPIKNLKKLREMPDAPVLIVEGEKTWDAGEKYFVGSVTTTWIGGVQGVKYTDWKPLAGRVVVLWPDNDQPGYDAMHAIHDILIEVGVNKDDIKWITPPKDVEKGWDLADAKWDLREAKKFVSENTGPYKEKIKWEDPEAKLTEQIAETVVKNANETISDQLDQSDEDDELKGVLNLVMRAEAPPTPPPDENNPEDFVEAGGKYFKSLGVQKEGNGMVYYFYAKSTKTVIGLSPSSMTANNLMQLAPLRWWQNTFQDPKKSFGVDRAANWLIHICSRNGTFSEKRLRGRGAWRDQKRIVIHTGDKLLVNGKEVALTEMDSRFIYEIGEQLNLNIQNPLKLDQANRLIPLLKKLNWDRPINAHLLAGWMVVAPVCGALDWRPHIWILGAASTGKTWIMKNIVRRMLGDVALVVQGETTEPGLRQALNNDAIPVVFDEAEGQDKKSQERMQSILGAARVASSDNSGAVTKGGQGSGGSRSYALRSCFAFSSIIYSALKDSDLSRITTLNVLKANGEAAAQRWKDFQAEYNDMFTDEFCESLRSRTISMLPTILKNITTFSNAAVAHLGEQRAGDQIGVLLAGAFSLVSDHAVTYDQALKWIGEQDWAEERSLASTRDEISLLHYILEYQVRVETRSATVGRTIGELVLCAMGLISAENDIPPGHANEVLRRMGMKVAEDHLYISNSDANIQKMLAFSKWPSNHSKVLERLEGATKEESQRFSAGVKTRAVKIPKDTIFKDFRDDRPVLVQPEQAPTVVVEEHKKKGGTGEQTDFTFNPDDDHPF